MVIHCAVDELGNVTFVMLNVAQRIFPARAAFIPLLNPVAYVTLKFVKLSFSEQLPLTRTLEVLFL